MTPPNPAGDAKRPLVVGLGEALFDCFPDRVVLGGAPLNVAVHAAALLREAGGDAVPVTRVGADELGSRFAAEVAARGLSTRYVQRDGERPTGRVAVKLDEDGHASYVFDLDSAWDALEFDGPLRELASHCDAVAFGTLAQRSPPSREAVQSFVGAAKNALRLFDVNLRQQYYSAEVLDASMRLATAVKLNEEELATVSHLLDLGSGTADGVDRAARRLADAYHLDWVALTRGAEGTALYAADEKCQGAPVSFPAARGADSVGAGDACCAGLLCGMLLGWPLPRTLDLANAAGAYVASRPGATPTLPDDVLNLVRGRG